MRISTNCTIPSTIGRSHFVTSPNTRGTLDILWSCLSVIILCTWTIQHLNVPAPTRPTTNLQALRRRVYLTLGKLRWMGVALVCPEALLAKAYVEFRSAMWYEAEFKERKYVGGEGVEWSMAHSFYANMGGFVVEFPAEGTEHVVGDIDGNERWQMYQRFLTGVQQKQSESTGAAECDQPVVQEVTPNLPVTIDKSGADPRYSPPHNGEVVDCNDNNPVAEKERPTDFVAEMYPALLMPSDAEQTMRLRRELSGLLKSHQKFYRLEVVNSKMSKKAGATDWPISVHNRELTKAAIATVREEEILYHRYFLWYSNLLALQGQKWMVDCSQLYLLRAYGIVARLPSISTDELDDQNKGDFLIKGLAVLQVTWLIVQLVVRAARHLAISQLETLTLSLAACSFVTYILLWSKPQDVRTTRKICASRYPTVDEISSIANVGPCALGFQRRAQWIPNVTIPRYGGKNPMGPMGIAAALGGLLFGSLHFLAWNFEFPSTTERWLWRASSIITVGLPLFTVAANIAFSRYIAAVVSRRHGVWGPSRFTKVAGIVVASAYGFARVFVLFEVFYSLAYLPPDAYRTTWSSNVPHIG